MQNDNPQGESIVVQHNETFATNIATLYYDAFFMHEGSIGKVAQETVDMLYEILSLKMGNSEYVMPQSEEDVTKNKQELCKRLSVILNKRFGFYEDLIIREKEAVLLLTRLINIVGEDIWREQLQTL